MSPCLTQRKKGSSQKRGAQRFRQESYMNNCKFTNNRWTKLDQTLINFNVNASPLQIKLNLERASPRGWFVNGLNLRAQSFRATQTGFWITRHASRNFSWKIHQEFLGKSSKLISLLDFWWKLFLQSLAVLQCFTSFISTLEGLNFARYICRFILGNFTKKILNHPKPKDL